jgi:hypothetical protein
LAIEEIDKQRWLSDKKEMSFVWSKELTEAAKTRPAASAMRTELTFLILALALFTFKKICKIEIVALSFVFDKYCPIMD